MARLLSDPVAFVNSFTRGLRVSVAGGFIELYLMYGILLYSFNYLKLHILLIDVDRFSICDTQVQRSDESVAYSRSSVALQDGQ